MGSKWPYNYYFEGFYFQDLLKTEYSTLVHFPCLFYVVLLLGVKKQEKYGEWKTSEKIMVDIALSNKDLRQYYT